MFLVILTNSLLNDYVLFKFHKERIKYNFEIDIHILLLINESSFFSMIEIWKDDIL